MADEPGAPPAEGTPAGDPPPAATPPPDPGVGLLDTGANPPEPGEGKYDKGDWRNGLPPEWQGHSAIKDINSMESMVKSFVSAQKMTGEDKNLFIRKPKEGATPEQVREFRTQMGVPEKADDYIFDMSKVAKELGDHTEVVDGMKVVFHELGISKDNGEKIITSFFEKQTTLYEKSVQDVAGMNAKATEALKADWGEAYPQKLAMAKEALIQFDDDGGHLKEVIAQFNLNRNEHFIKFLSQIGERTLDDTVIQGITGGDKVMSAVEAKAKLDAMNSDPEFFKKLTSTDPAVAAAANEERKKLFPLLSPGK